MKNYIFKTKKIRFLITLFIFIFLVGCAEIQFGSGISKNDIKTERVNNLSGIQNITGELYINPGNLQSYYNILSETKTGLKIQVYEFTEKTIKNLVKNLLKKGTEVKIIIEDKKFKQYRNTFKELSEFYTGYLNFQIKSDKQMGTQYIHSKVDLLDNDFLIKTNNITHSAFTSSREYMFHSYNSKIKQSLDKIFNKDWNGEKINLEDIHPNLLVCNINCRNVIEYYLNNAQDSIFIETQYITDNRIWNILKNKSNLSGFNIIVANTDDNTKLLNYFGPQKVKKLKKPYVHAKMILIDNKYLILGSMNLSENSLDNNREIGIILIDDNLINKFLLQFKKDWK